MNMIIVNAFYIVVGILLLITGSAQILSQPNIWVYISTTAGAAMVIIGLFGLRKAKAF